MYYRTRKLSSDELFIYTLFGVYMRKYAPHMSFSSLSGELGKLVYRQRPCPIYSAEKVKFVFLSFLSANVNLLGEIEF